MLGLMAASLPSCPGRWPTRTVYPAVVLVLLLAAGGLCWRTVVSGLLGLVRRATPDSLAVLPLLGAAVQCIVAAAASNYTADVTLLAGPAVLVLCLNTVGKRMNACTVQENFRLVSAKVEHSVAYRLKDAGALRAVTTGLAEPHPNVLVNRPTQIFRSFLTQQCGGRHQRQKPAAVCLAGRRLCAGGHADHADPYQGQRSRHHGAGKRALCLGGAAGGHPALGAACPHDAAQRRPGGGGHPRLAGHPAAGPHQRHPGHRPGSVPRRLRDACPASSRSSPKHIDLAIVYAASVLADAGPTLREVFLGMLGGNKNLLAEVEDRETVYGKGYVGWIKKRRVLVGNRALMQDYGVKLPSLEYEQHHTVNQRRVIYLAVSGKLFAMFQVAYQRDPDTAAVLDGLRRTGHVPGGGRR